MDEGKTLTEFLEARLDEDEAVARAAAPGPWQSAGTWHLEGVEHRVVSGPSDPGVAFTWDEEADHIARHDPTRVLREVEAKRALLYDLDPYGGGLDLRDGVREALLRHLASVYSDHPDFREEWRP